ncbi:MAG: DUF6867 family protein [Pseudomonadota bacterium]
MAGRLWTLLTACLLLIGLSNMANAQLDDLTGVWSDPNGQIQIEFFEGGTYALTGVPGIEVEEVTGRFVVPPSNDRIVVRLNELGRGAVFTLVEGDEGLTLANDELFGGEITFERPTSIWLQLGTTPRVLILLTLLFFGGAALLTGQALANGWQPLWKCVPYGVLLGLGDRFLNYALFQGPLLSLPGFLVSTFLIVGFTILGYSLVKATKMTTQYPWLYERRGLFGWRSKAPAAESGGQ